MKKAETDKIILNRLLTGLVRVLAFSLSLSALWLMGAVCPMVLCAEVPVKFTYQGNLRQAGFLVNGPRSMVFRIYDSSTSAAELWTSPAYNVQLSTGVFRVVLEPTLADWQSGSLWLELEIAGNRMAPREELTASPYAINSLMLSGKRYTTAAAAPAASAAGDLWYDTSQNAVKYWNGTAWTATGAGLPAAHALLHAGGGSDAITSLGAHAVTGALTVDGVLNPAANLSIGGGGYSVSFASSVTAGWYYGDGSGLDNLDASKIASGSLSGNRIGNVIVSTHIVDGSILNQDLADGSVTRAKLNQSGCIAGEVLRWDGVQWSCASSGAGPETDPHSIHNQETLQAGTTFYVSSGTVNDLNVGNSLRVTGSAWLRGGPGQQGLSVESTGNVAIGMSGASARLEVKGSDTQSYSLAVGTGTVSQVVVSTSGAVGIGTENPRARMEVTGAESPGEYIMMFNSGPKMAAWLRNK